jgi:nitroimidazol reductase NimA-like FMN-containing flavoprotein (pyridoxamine 5'-phosphate oxidase superfamily)
VVILGTATQVTDDDERMHAFETIVEHVMPDRWREVRWPNERELKATMVLKVPLAEASAKVRAGGPIDDPEDMSWPCWAGQIPLKLTPLARIPDEPR